MPKDLHINSTCEFMCAWSKDKGQRRKMRKRLAVDFGYIIIGSEEMECFHVFSAYLCSYHDFTHFY